MPVSASNPPAFRYTAHGHWLKGNTHIHSTASDGGKTFVELAAMYAGAGYDFLFRTDHWVLSDVAADPQPYPLLWLDGVELDGKDRRGAYFHVVCLGQVRDVHRNMGFEPALKAARQQGALLVLAHPYWTGNSLDDARRWGFDAVEVYNHVCHWLNGKSHGGVHWHALLKRQRATLGLAVDDAHTRPEHPGWNGGWIRVRATERTREAIMTAIHQGDFYSSCGPEFHAIEQQGDQIRIRTSPVRFIRLVGPDSQGERQGSFEGEGQVTEAAFPAPRDWRYAYLEIEDTQGRRAWTNTLYMP